MKNFLCLAIAITGVLPFVAHAEPRIISVNFTDGSTKVSEGEFSEQQIGYDSFAVKGRQWIDCQVPGGGSGSSTPNTPISIPITDNTGDTESYAGVRFSICSRPGMWSNDSTSTDGNSQMLKTYLDDQMPGGGGGGASYNRPGFKLTGLPTARSTVVIYFSGDGSNTSPLCAYQVNGSYYKGSAQGTVPAQPADSWGNPVGQTTIDLNSNTLIVTNVVGSSITVQASLQSPSRGRIAGFQVIMDDPSYRGMLTGDAKWSDKTGITEKNGPWVNNGQSSIILINNLETPATLTLDEEIVAATLKMVGTGETALNLAEGVTLGIGTYDLGESGKTTFNFTTGDSAVSAGEETVFTRQGTGTLTIGQGMTAVWNGFMWDSAKVINNGTVRLIGGTEEAPLQISSVGHNAKVGNYHIASNSWLRSTSSKGNKCYFIDGDGAKTSTLILHSNEHWGMADGTSIRNVKVKARAPQGVEFWFERAHAFDKSIWLDLDSTTMLLAGIHDPSPSFTIGALSGNGTITVPWYETIPRNLTVDMSLGPQTYSGTIDKVNLTVGGSDELTLTKGRAAHASGTVTIIGGSRLAYDTAEDVYIKDALSGGGTLSKRGSGTLTLAGDNTGFTGDFAVAGGGLVIAGKTVDVRTAITGSATSITIGKMDDQNPVLNLTSIPEGSGKIPLYLILDDIDFSSGKILKTIRFGEGISTNNFTIRVFSDSARTDERDTSTYQLACKENVLTLRSLIKTWSGSTDGSGEWNTQTENLYWNDGTSFFQNNDKVLFGNIPGKHPTVTVTEKLTAGNIGLAPGDSSYTFHSKPGAYITLSGALIAANGETRLNVPLNTMETSDIQVTGDAKLTLGSLFGANITPETHEAFYEKAIKIPDTGTLILAPGKGKTEKITKLLPAGNNAKLIVTNGTVVALSDPSSGVSGAFQSMQVQIDRDGVLVFDENIDISGYGDVNKNRPIVINPGGKLWVKKRDTLIRGITFNGGTLALSGMQNDCALILYKGPIVRVNANSEIIGCAGGKNWDHPDQGSIDNPQINLMKGHRATFMINRNSTFTHAVTYSGEGEFYVTGEDSQKGRFVQNGMLKPDGSGRYPLIYTGRTSIEPGVIYELNCEHQNGNGVYGIWKKAVLCGNGSITGPGTVFIGYSGGAILRGNLTINSLSFYPVPVDNPTKLGEGGTLCVRVTGKLATEGEANILLDNGSFTICKDCNAEGFSPAKIKIAKAGILAVEAGKTLNLAAAPVFEENGTLRIGADYQNGDPVFGSFAFGSGVDLTGVAFEVEIESGRLKGNRIPLLTATDIIHADKALTGKLPAERKWKYVVEENGDGTKTLFAEVKSAFLLILK